MIQWIDVNDRLPEPVDQGTYSDWVLVFPYDPKSPPDTLIGVYAFHRQRFETGSGEPYERAITHWMPLPEPPKEEPAP